MPIVSMCEAYELRSDLNESGGARIPDVYTEYTTNSETAAGRLMKVYENPAIH